MTSGGTGQLEILRLQPALADALTRFFAALVASGATRTFHPHPFDAATASERCNYSGADVYAVVVRDGHVLAYGLLRGWDDGFDVPSLGIAVDASVRGLGIGRLLMHYLHSEARCRGAKRIRLKVYPDNASALALYRSLGYEFGATLEQGQCVGWLTLVP